MDTSNYSVLMSVYYKEKPEYLRESMQSIFNQTVATNNFVLICDGPLTPALDAVIAEMQDKYPSTLHVHRLKENGGLGNALNIGMQFCTNDLVARMDSDDISRPDSCKKELSVFKQIPNISIVSGIVEEFITDTEHIESRRVVPESQKDILNFAKKRNPFNHPCVMYRKSDVQMAGSYKDFYLLEDYFLWIRMLQKGYQGFNLQEPLLWMRARSDLYKRRGGWKYMKSQLRLLKYMKQTGFINTEEYLSGCLLRFGSSVAPNKLRSEVYKKLLRSE